MGSSKNQRTPLLTIGVLLAVGIALTFYVFDRRARIAAMEALCRELGGHYSTDLVDGNYVLDFTGTNVTNQELADVMRLAEELPDPLTLDYSGDIWLTLAETEVDDAGMQHLIPRVTFLDLQGVNITDKGTSIIVERTPRVFSLILAETNINDDAIRVLAQRPPQLLLDLSNTSISAEGLRPLSGAMCDVIVEGTGITKSDLEALSIDVFLSTK